MHQEAVERLSVTFTANCKLLPSVFSSLYSRIKIFVFAVNGKRQFEFLFLYEIFTDNMKRIEKER